MFVNKDEIKVYLEEGYTKKEITEFVNDSLEEIFDSFEKENEDKRREEMNTKLMNLLETMDTELTSILNSYEDIIDPITKSLIESTRDINTKSKEEEENVKKFLSFLKPLFH